MLHLVQGDVPVDEWAALLLAQVTHAELPGSQQQGIVLGVEGGDSLVLDTTASRFTGVSIFCLVVELMGCSRAT